MEDKNQYSKISIQNFKSRNSFSRYGKHDYQENICLNIFIRKWFTFASIENLTKDTWQVFPVGKIFPLGKKSPSGKNLPSGKSCQENQNDFHKFKR